MSIVWTLYLLFNILFQKAHWNHCWNHENTKTVPVEPKQEVSERDTDESDT